MMKLVRVFVLALTVSVCAHAGDMPNGVTAGGVMDNGVRGNMDNGAPAASASPATARGGMQSGRTDPISELALSLLQGVFGLF